MFLFLVRQNKFNLTFHSFSLTFNLSNHTALFPFTNFHNLANNPNFSLLFPFDFNNLNNKNKTTITMNKFLNALFGLGLVSIFSTFKSPNLVHFL
jgi:hypothetical protein